MKFGRKAQLNRVVKIAIILYSQPCLQWHWGCVYKTKGVQQVAKIVMDHNLPYPTLPFLSCGG